ncbi:MAG: hypothetical protein AAFS10_07530 [Myxococcota bacterium]
MRQVRQPPPRLNPHELFKRRVELERLTDPFAILGVHWTDHAKTIQASYTQQVEALLPQRGEAMEEDCVGIRDRLMHARDQLATQPLRHQARLSFISMKEFENVLSLYTSQIKILMWRNAHERAEEICLRALELDPGHVQAARALQKIKRHRDNPLVELKLE